MENVTYKISEKFTVREQINIEDLMAEVANTDNPDEGDSDVSCDANYATHVDYATNFNVKQLGMILDYYEILKRNLRKEEMVNEIVLYESEPSNRSKVERRKRLWENVAELKKDKFFAKYLIVEL